MRTTLFIFILWTTTSSFGQQSATLSGSVQDSTGGVIGKASVRVTNIHTGESFGAVTTDAGLYTIPLIKPGEYESVTEAPGFKQFKQTGLRLETGATYASTSSSRWARSPKPSLSKHRLRY